MRLVDFLRELAYTFPVDAGRDLDDCPSIKEIVVVYELRLRICNKMYESEFDTSNNNLNFRITEESRGHPDPFDLRFARVVPDIHVPPLRMSDSRNSAEFGPVQGGKNMYLCNLSPRKGGGRRNENENKS